MPRYISAIVALLLTTASAGVHSHEGEWVSYRDAYRVMVVFEKYGKPKNFLQNHYQVMPRDQSVPPTDLRLALIGKSTHVNLPLDATGRAVFPLLKAAYDENAALVLDRPAGHYVMRPRLSVVIRHDGVYEAAELFAACEQALNYERFLDASARGKKCAAMRFVFAKKGMEPAVRVRLGGGEQGSLPVEQGAAFDGDPNEGFKIVHYRFAGSADKGQVETRDAPLAIVPVFQ